MLLRDVDMPPVKVGPAAYHVDCAFCECAGCESASARRPRVAAAVACDACEEGCRLYCGECFERTHVYLPKHNGLPIERCVACDFQVATRLCGPCGDGYCCTCFELNDRKKRAGKAGKGAPKQHPWEPLFVLCGACKGDGEGPSATTPIDATRTVVRSLSTRPP